MSATYDRLAGCYDTVFAPIERLFLARMRHEALSFIPAGSRTLELGAGTGANFAHCGRFTGPVASELSAEMLRRAARRSNSVSLVQADAQYLPFADDSFDAAFATLVFCSIPDPERAFREVRRAVRPGGIVILLEHVRPKGLLGHCFDVLNTATTALIDDHFNRRTAETAQRSRMELVEVRGRFAGIIQTIICRVPDPK